MLDSWIKANYFADGLTLDDSKNEGILRAFNGTPIYEEIRRLRNSNDDDKSFLSAVEEYIKKSLSAIGITDIEVYCLVFRPEWVAFDIGLLSHSFPLTAKNTLYPVYELVNDKMVRMEGCY